MKLDYISISILYIIINYEKERESEGSIVRGNYRFEISGAVSNPYSDSRQKFKRFNKGRLLP